jgi:NAD(P)H-hydrate epimerase
MSSKENKNKIDFKFNYVLIGNSNVGKSSLLKSFFNNKNSEKIEDYNTKKIDLEDKKILIKFYNMFLFREIQGLIFVYDITDLQSFEKINFYLKEINFSKKIFKILIGNKKDLENERKITFEQGKNFADSNEMLFFETSAKEKMNIQEPILSMTKEIIKKLKEKNNKIPFINSEQSKLIDETLMNTYNYSIDQLMEIAGLTVAKIISNEILKKNPQKILCICGPGNNGGDGLVASRYLKEFGYEIDIYYPKPNVKNPLFKRLISQCEAYEIKIISNEIVNYSNYSFFIDAIFGFSFKGEIRQPFKNIIDELNNFQDKIVSVDIPSGFDVENGNVNHTFVPNYLISLTLPKLCSKNFNGRHFLGGRFVPLILYKKLNIQVDNNLYDNLNSDLYLEIK